MFSFLRSIKYGKSISYLIVLNIIFSVLANVLILAAPLFAGFAVDNMLGTNQVLFSEVLINLKIVAGLYLVGTFFNYFSIYMANLYAIKLCQIIKTKAFYAITNTPLEILESSASGDVLVRLTLDIVQLQDAITFFFTHFFTGITTIIFSLIVLFWLNIVFALVVVLSVIPIYIYTRYIAKSGDVRFRKIQNLTANLTNYAQEMFDEQEVVLSFNYHQEAKKEFNKRSNELYEETKKAYFSASMNNPTFRLLQNITYAVLGLVFLLLILTQSPLVVATGTFMSIIMYAGVFAKPVNEMSAVTQQFLLGSASLGRIEPNLEDEKIVEHQVNISLKNYDIVYHNVGFNTINDNEILKEVNISIPYGTKVGVVGPSGAGKTSFTALLLRFFKISEGHITLGGVDIENFSQKEYSQMVAAVLQDPWVFRGSFLQNLSYGNDNIDLEKVIEVSKMTGCHDFIVSFNDGYETIVDETINLSLGQRQLLTLARVIIADPLIYVFDEPTSNLDVQAESKIQTVIQDVTKNKTSIVVAHKLKTIIDYDLIIVFDGGKIAESGNHQTLMNKKGLYYTLYRKQYED